MKHARSSLPRNVTEKTVREPQQEGTLHDYRITDCLLNRIRVGQRIYNGHGIMILETPLQDGLKHGRELSWDDDGRLSLVEPYVKGKIHGTAKQYGRDGNVIGTYRLVHGTGLDIWRQEHEDKTVYISEIHSLQDGVPHGYEWHFVSSKQVLWQERHWHMGKVHGIERIWNARGRLRRGYPKFYVLDQLVSKLKYLRLALSDKTLPVYRAEDDLPERDYPAEIRELLSR